MSLLGKIGGIVMALIGLACLGYSAFFVSQVVMLMATGHSTTGAVTKKSASTDQDNHTTYYLSYSYADDAGQTHTATSDASATMYEEAEEGAAIPVVYSSTYPSISSIRAVGAGLLPGGMFALMGVGFLWWGLYLVLRRIHWENKQARLMTKGERRIGRLVAVEEDTSEQAEDYIPLMLVYTFNDKTGQERTGKTFHVNAQDHDFWKGRIGCPLDVRVNPADPEDHIALVDESKLLS